MKKAFKYPLAAVFALLMGYSQVFAFFQPSPTTHLSKFDTAVQRPAPTSSAFENAAIGEVEEDEDYRSSFTEGVSSAVLISYWIEPAPAWSQPITHSLPPPRSEDSYLRLRVIRLRFFSLDRRAL